MSMSYKECLADTRPSRPQPDTPSNVLRQFDMTGKVCIITGASRGK